MKFHPIEELIRSHIPELKPTKKGWWNINCRVCNDHGRKGRRGAFKFDIETIGYNCFNCAKKFEYHTNRPTASKEMYYILGCYGISEPEINLALMDVAATLSIENILTPKSVHQRAIAETIPIEPTEIWMPEHFFPLELAQPDDVIANLAREYLITNRKIDPSSYPFMVSTDVKWQGRLILPVFKNEKLIYYTGRDLLDKYVNKYKNCDYVSDNVLFGFEHLFDYSERNYLDKPLYIHEGIFDAMVIPGVAVLTNIMSDGQIRWLKRSNRKKVVVPDRRGDGFRLAEQALNLGWEVALPDIGSCKDMTDAVKEYGRIYVMKSLAENTFSGFEGKTKAGILCQ